jgi:DnaJ-class molecular chaperone
MTDMPFATQDDLQIFRLLRGNAPIPDGACQDCGGHQLVPSMDATAEAGLSLWRPCPTCRGSGEGGIA